MTMLRLIFLALLLYLIYLIVRFFQSIGQPSKKDRSTADSLPRRRMVKDEICNTYIPEEESLKETWKGQVYYFCSEECRQKFLTGKKTPVEKA